MITSKTTTASNPVAACKSSARILSLSESTIRTAMNQVIKVAPNATPAPTAIGRRCALFAPVMLAVIAASTRMHSNPSRKTRTPMSRNATVGLVLGWVGSGAPCAVIPCHTIVPRTAIAATKMPIPKMTRQGRSTWCKAVALTVKAYHSRKSTAAGGLRFFSGGLRGSKRIRNPGNQELGQAGRLGSIAPTY